MNATFGRAAFWRALIAVPVAGLALRAEATDYASAEEVLDTVGRLEAEVEARLHAVAAALPAARPFVQSLLADYVRHRERRAGVRRRLRLAPQPAPAPSDASADASLAGLRTALEALVYAHAEGMPALDDPPAVDAMAQDMVDLSRHLTVVDLWIEQEEARG